MTLQATQSGDCLRHAWRLGAAIVALTAVAVAATVPPAAAAEEAYASWPVLKNPFPSTGGGGIMIEDYDPVVVGSICMTNFVAREPNGTAYRNAVEFDAIPTQGGILCNNGR